MRRPMQMPSVRTDAFSLRGGLSLNRSALEAISGTLIDCINYEPHVAGGYERIKGYERFDGRPSPSDATYAKVAATLNPGHGVVSGTVLTIGAATCVFMQEVTGGFLATKVTGTIPNSTTINKPGPTAVGTTAADAVLDYYPTNAQEAQHLYDAAEHYRPDIQAVPGSGPIRGVWFYNDVVYAFRHHTDGLSTKMWKSTAAGWVEVALGYALEFDAGSGEISVGQTITGLTSGASAVVGRIEVRRGTWAGGTAKGVIIVSSITSGPFQDNESIQVGGVTKATANGASAAQVLAPNGSYEFVTGNFGAQVESLRMYGVDGVNKAFEFDGTYYVPITTGTPGDAPTHVAIHQNHLFLSFGSSAIHSELGFPHKWDASLSAGEIGTGDTINGFQVLPGQALGCVSRNSTRAILGTSSADWTVQTISPDSGGAARTIQSMGSIVMVDDRGLIEVRPGQEYGNFGYSTVSRQVQNLFDRYRDKYVASCILRGKNQYRVFTDDGTIIIMRMESGKGREFTLARFDDIPVCICSEESTSGIERIFFGAADGMVYEMEKGTSFDGDAILAVMVTWPLHGRAPTLHKTYRHAWFEFETRLYSVVEISPQFDYESGDTLPESSSESDFLFTVRGHGGRWDSAYFESFFWDSPYVSKMKMDISGSGFAIAFIILSDSAIDKGHLIRAVEYTYSPRKQNR